MLTRILHNAIVIFIGLILPAHETFKTIETRNEKEKRRWLSYWTIFAFLVITEYCCPFILTRLGIVYVVLKFAFLYWLQAPQYEGSLYIVDLGLISLIGTRDLWIEEKLQMIGQKISVVSGQFVAVVVHIVPHLMAVVTTVVSQLNTLQNTMFPCCKHSASAPAPTTGVKKDQ
jgi:hypothetical protein